MGNFEGDETTPGKPRAGVREEEILHSQRSLKVGCGGTGGGGIWHDVAGKGKAKSFKNDLDLSGV